jgi:capsular polysaccharide biosynthesis protein
MDVRTVVRTLRRRRRLLLAAAGAGLSAGLAYAVLMPQMATATAQVVLPPATSSVEGTPVRDVQTQVAIATSGPVLSRALGAADTELSLRALEDRITVTAVTQDILAISAQGRTASEARNLADAVADGYLAYAWPVDLKASAAPDAGPQAAAGAQVLEYASLATRPPVAVHLAVWAALGALAGGALAAGWTVIASRNDLRLRRRDDIADAVGLPVVASLPTRRPTDPAGWLQLLRSYTPGAVDSWSLRKVLRLVAPADQRAADVMVLCMAGDHRALAAGPQLAAFAASLGVRTALELSTQDPSVATLRTACSTAATRPPRPLLAVTPPDGATEWGGRGAALTVVVSVADRQRPRLDGTRRTAVVLLAVSAGFATAEDLARLAVAAADDDREILGILVTAPDPEDRTSGLLPQAARPAVGQLPTRTTGLVREPPG